MVGVVWVATGDGSPDSSVLVALSQTTSSLMITVELSVEFLVKLTQPIESVSLTFLVKLFSVSTFGFIPDPGNSARIYLLQKSSESQQTYAVIGLDIWQRVVELEQRHLSEILPDVTSRNI